MAQTFSNVAANIASIVDTSEIRSIDTEFNMLELLPTPLVGWLPNGPAVRLGENLLYEKIVDRMLPRTVTLGAAAVTTDTSLTLTSTSDAQRLQVGHLLLIDSELVRIGPTAAILASHTTVSYVKGFGGTTDTTHASGTVARVMSPVFSDGATFVQSVSSAPEFKTFLPFIIMYEDSITPIRSATRTYLEKGQDPLQFRLNRLRQERMPEFEALLLHSRASTISATVAGAPAGIRQLISTNSTAVSGALTATHIEDMLETLYGWNGRRKITIVGNGAMQRIWSAVWRQYFDKTGTPQSTPRIGFAVTTYESPTMGDVDFLRCDSCLSTELLFLDKSSWAVHPLNWAYGSGWQEFTRGTKETNALGTTTGMYYGGVFTVDDERLNGKLTGITTTSSAYAGYV